MLQVWRLWGARMVAVASRNRADQNGLSSSSVVSLDRRLVSGLAVDLDNSRYAGFRDADADCEQCTSRLVAVAGRRIMVDHCEREIHRRRVSQSLVGKYCDGVVVCTGDLRSD